MEPAISPTTFCNICHKSLETNEMLKTSCNHEFCRVCFFTWLKEKPNCPVCREQFTKPRIEELTEELEVILQDIDEYSRYRDILAQGIVREEQRLRKIYDREKNKMSSLITEKNQINADIEMLKHSLQELKTEKNDEEKNLKVYQENIKIKKERDHLQTQNHRQRLRNDYMMNLIKKQQQQRRKSLFGGLIFKK
jgi:chromosome segregation ATPase